MESNIPERSPHSSPDDCERARTVVFTDEYVMQDEKVARLAECTVCGRKFERVWFFSHDQCYEPEHQRVNLRR